MDDDEKTKFFTTVDAAHKAKNEAYGNAPFDGGKPIPKVRKDQFGNVIKDKNVAKNLAKKGMATVKEDDEIEEAALKLKGFGKDAGPSNMSNPIARASLMKSKPAVKKKVSDMTTAEKMANSKRRKEYNEYQQSKRNEEVESDLDENEIIEPEVVETQTPEVEAVVDQNMQAYVTQITQHAKDTNF
jgi:hypothetical protein